MARKKLHRKPENLMSRMRQTRLEKRISQVDLASAAGVSRASISAWESGDTQYPRPEHVVHLARALGVRVEWLVLGEPPVLVDTPIIDVNVLSDIIVGVTREMRGKKRLTPQRKAQLIALLYEHIVQGGWDVDRNVIARFAELTHPNGEQ